MLTRNPIVHVEIAAKQLERAMAFYRQVFQIEWGAVLELHGSRMAYFPFAEGLDGASVALAEGEAYCPSTQGAIVYFAVDDLPAAVARAVQAGAEILFPITPLDDGSAVAEISDSEGNRIALQMPPINPHAAPVVMASE